MNNKTRKLKKNKKIKQKGGYIVPPTNPYFMAAAALIGGLYVLGQAQSSKTDAEPTAAPSQPQGQSGGRKFRRTRSKRQTGGTNNNMNIVLASHDGNTEIVEKLLKNGVDVEERYRGWTALIKASQQGHIEILKMLLENDADVNARLQGGKDSTALIQASHGGHTEIVRMLLENGADVNATAPTGYHEATALMEASQQGHIEIVKMLLENGANVNAKDEDGRTALDKAKIVAPWRTHRPNTEVNSEVVNLLTNAEKVRDNKQKAMEQVEGRVRKVPSLHALTLKELNTTELNNLNKYNIFPTRKKLGGKRRTRKSKKFKESKKTKKKYMRRTRRRNKRKGGGNSKTRKSVLTPGTHTFLSNLKGQEKRHDNSNMSKPPSLSSSKPKESGFKITLKKTGDGFKLTQGPKRSNKGGNKRKTRRKQKGGDRELGDMVVDLTLMFLPSRISMSNFNDKHDLKNEIIHKVKTTNDMGDLEGGLKAILELFLDVNGDGYYEIENYDIELEHQLKEILEVMCERPDFDCSNPLIQDILQ